MTIGKAYDLYIHIISLHWSLCHEGRKLYLVIKWSRYLIYVSLSVFIARHLGGCWRGWCHERQEADQWVVPSWCPEGDLRKGVMFHWCIGGTCHFPLVMNSHRSTDHLALSHTNECSLSSFISSSRPPLQMIWSVLLSFFVCIFSMLRYIIYLMIYIFIWQNGQTLLQLALDTGTESIIRVVSGIRPSMVSIKMVYERPTFINSRRKNATLLPYFFLQVCKNDMHQILMSLQIMKSLHLYIQMNTDMQL